MEEYYAKGRKIWNYRREKIFRTISETGKFTASFKGKGSENLTFADVKKDLSLVNDYVAQMSVEELARLSVGGIRWLGNGRSRRSLVPWCKWKALIFQDFQLQMETVG